MISRHSLFRLTFFAWVVCLAALHGSAASAQRRGSPPQPNMRPAPPPVVERLGNGLIRIGKLEVNTTTREVRIPGTINEVQTLEFLANTPGGMKAYESALTLDSTGVMLNTAMLLIGVEPPKTPPIQYRRLEGDPLELWIETAAPPQRFRAERLVYDLSSKKELVEGPWIYTGSATLPNGRFLSDVEGVLIGLIHTRSAIIDQPDAVGLGRYGAIVINPSLGLPPGAAITLVVKAIGPSR